MCVRVENNRLYLFLFLFIFIFLDLGLEISIMSHRLQSYDYVTYKNIKDSRKIMLYHILTTYNIHNL